MDQKDFEEEIESMTIHGLPKIFNATSWRRRLLWSILFAITVLSYFYFSTDVIKQFRSNEIYVTTTTIPEENMSLPAMTFCNTNLMSPFMDESLAVAHQKLPENCSQTNRSYFKTDKNREYFLNGCKTFLASYEHKKAISGHRPIQFPKDYDLVPVAMPCFRLNANLSLIQYAESQREGLRMYLFFNASIKTALETTAPIVEERKGLYIDLHDPKEIIRHFQGVYLPTGFYTHITVRKRKIIRLLSPFPSKCTDGSTVANSELYHGQYSRPTCFYACMADNCYKNCGDVPAIFNDLTPTSRYPSQGNKTLNEKLECFFKCTEGINVKGCDCPLPCRETKYETKVDREPWPQPWQVDFLKPALAKVAGISVNDVTEDLVKQHLIMLNVYYDELSTTNIEEKQLYTFGKILSDVGGQMGMFLGASFISLIEIICLVFSMIVQCWKKRKKNDVKPISIHQDQTL
eukprot:Seg1260.11 transcript_id=Seg1260.11/GoldUCD/mRNA.D3Y31 product="Degenerin-like protein unc-105" protein_id=Seg1260.11/GoldUCD/D3Y31